jgi:GNAT superfamily N-acetyltransferase
MSAPPFTTRLATSADKEPVLAFCAQTWEHGDYIAEVWDEWLHDPRSSLLVGHLDQQPIALAHILVVEGEGWFEGLRIAPEFRNQGYGRLMLISSLVEAQRLGATTLRLITRSSNEAMMNLLPRLGFEHCFDAAWFSAPFAPGPKPEPVLLSVDQLQLDLATAPMLRDTGGLFADGWSFSRLTHNRLAQHLAAQQIVHVPGIAGWAIIMLDGESDRPAIGMITGNIPALYQALRAHPLAQHQGALHTFLPLESNSVKLAMLAGYEQRTGEFAVFAHPLSPS